MTPLLSWLRQQPMIAWRYHLMAADAAKKVVDYQGSALIGVEGQSPSPGFTRWPCDRAPPTLTPRPPGAISPAGHPPVREGSRTGAYLIGVPRVRKPLGQSLRPVRPPAQPWRVERNRRQRGAPRGPPGAAGGERRVTPGQSGEARRGALPLAPDQGGALIIRYFLGCIGSHQMMSPVNYGLLAQPRE